MKTIYQFSLLLSIVILASLYTYGQKNGSIMKWEASVSSGLFVDLFYANISIIGDAYHANPASYINKPGNGCRQVWQIA